MFTKAIVVIWAACSLLGGLVGGYILFRNNDDKRLDRCYLRINRGKVVSFVTDTVEDLKVKAHDFVSGQDDEYIDQRVG